eukprot:CAMPEP_0174706602 /NCGR_PEP_ID=MMETSP1094-20130205/9389_1 /TAXON_ID=156173 /ORGANISM="Chrysochromulina brevifilum, Strain UTEX LB 985" /LENGTH=60 /DNA_ID=CAMNT_0015904881 /DNA_START=127 /DNA_END=309 /DNA_ORIENTATION=+
MPSPHDGVIEATRLEVCVVALADELVAGGERVADLNALFSGVSLDNHLLDPWPIIFIDTG